LTRRCDPTVGDRGFEDLYEEEFANVFRAAYALIGDVSAAEDATQEAFARALARWRRLRGEPWAGGWVMTTALNVARRQLRRRPVIALVETPADAHDLVEVRLAIRALPTRQQQAVVLHYLLDLPLADVARSMGCREGTVKAHLAKARRGLAERLGSRPGGDADG
jgi:RNA polymerase sigma-70 factor (ECF subfamily)